MGYAHLAFLGPESNWAAEASECADEQGAFWVYNDKLFASQAGENQGAFKKDNLKKFAADLKLDTGKFNTCLDSSKYAPVVAAETSALQSLGFDSTPAFMLNGQKMQGALPFGNFQQTIEAIRRKQK
jgi:protein-disulfide isomerase